MTLTEVSRVGFKMPGRGTVRLGVYTAALTDYVNGTGLALSASALGLSRLIFVSIQPIDDAGVHQFDWDPTTEYLKAYVAATGSEAANDALDSVTATVFYLGF
jgi:hypothetical protein